MVHATGGKPGLARVAGGTVGGHIGRMTIGGSEAVITKAHGLGVTHLAQSGGRRPNRLDQTAVGIKQFNVF